VAQVCPLISEILRQLDVKLLKGLMGKCWVHPGRMASAERRASLAPL
jgi:hypothetical protein